MELYLASYSTPEWAGSQYLLNQSARAVGVNHIFPYTREQLVQTPFYHENREILDSSNGAGYWLWKPFIMLETMRKMSDGDMLIYLDSGFMIIADISPLVRLCIEQDGVLLFTNGYLNKAWTKRDCFVLMDCDEEKYYNVEQTVGGSHFWIKNSLSMEILESWLKYCCDPRLLTDIPNTCGLDNLPGFVLHRHDQSILTNISTKYGIERFRDPSEYGNSRKRPDLKVPGERIIAPPDSRMNCSQSVMENSSFGTILNLHRQAHPLSSIDPATGQIRQGS